MRHEFSFDIHGLGSALKIGALVAVIFVSFGFSDRQAQDILAGAGAAKNIKHTPAAHPRQQDISVEQDRALIGTSTLPGVYFRKTNLPRGVPVVEGAGAIAADLETGAILFEKNKDDPYPTASLAKLMTAAIAQETFASSSAITAGSDAASFYGNSAGIVRGESFRWSDLLYGLLLPSSNDAARMIERAEPDLLATMNAKAAELGMAHAHYADPAGLSQDTVASASDLIKLLRYLYLKHPEIIAVSRMREHSVVSGGRRIRHIWDNINWPAGDRKFLGGKAGFTNEAIETMAGIWAVNPSRSGNRPVGIVILGTRHRVNDVRAIENYIERQFVYATTTPAGSAQRPRMPFTGAAILEAVVEYVQYRYYLYCHRALEKENNLFSLLAYLAIISDVRRQRVSGNTREQQDLPQTPARR